MSQQRNIYNTIIYKYARAAVILVSFYKHDDGTIGAGVLHSGESVFNVCVSYVVSVGKCLCSTSKLVDSGRVPTGGGHPETGTFLFFIVNGISIIESFVS